MLETFLVLLPALIPFGLIAAVVILWIRNTREEKRYLEDTIPNNIRRLDDRRKAKTTKKTKRTHKVVDSEPVASTRIADEDTTVSDVVTAVAVAEVLFGNHDTQPAESFQGHGGEFGGAGASSSWDADSSPSSSDSSSSYDSSSSDSSSYDSGSSGFDSGSSGGSDW